MLGYMYYGTLKYKETPTIHYAVLAYTGIYNENRKLEDAYALRVDTRHSDVSNGIYYQIDCTYSEYVNSLD